MKRQSYVPSSEEQIRRTIAEYCHFTDTGDFDAWTGLFTEDGSFHMFGISHIGQTALRAFIEDDQPPERRGLHLTTDSVIDFGDGCAKVTSNFMFIASGQTANIVVAGGRYHDVLVPRGDRWLFQEREAVLFGPTATEKWGATVSDGASLVPWYAVTRATPVECRQPFGNTEADL